MKCIHVISDGTAAVFLWWLDVIPITAHFRPLLFFFSRQNRPDQLNLTYVQSAATK